MSERPRFDAVFTKDRIKKIENEYDEQWRHCRLAMMAVLEKSSDDLLNSVEGNGNEARAALLELINSLSAYQKHLEAGVELANSAIARLVTVGEHVFSEQQATN